MIDMKGRDSLEGTLVKLVDMDYAEPTGFNYKWLEGAVGTVLSSTTVKNLNDGYVSTLCIVNLLVPAKSVKGNDINWLGGISTENLEEIIRVPIKN